jgi:hypothetical protein
MCWTWFSIDSASNKTCAEFIKICQNTPQLCWGDEWPTLSPGRLCRNPILMVAAGFSLRATHWFYWNWPQPKGCDYQLRHSLQGEREDKFWQYAGWQKGAFYETIMKESLRDGKRILAVDDERVVGQFEF